MTREYVSRRTRSHHVPRKHTLFDDGGPCAVQCIFFVTCVMAAISPIIMGVMQ
jgi:hypothetical protein